MTIQEIVDAIIGFPTGEGPWATFFFFKYDCKIAPIMLKICQTAIAFIYTLSKYFLTFKDGQRLNIFAL